MTLMSHDGAYIEWGNVTISEDSESLNSFDEGVIIEISSTWTAEFEGHICNTNLDGTSTLPIISFSRTGKTAEEAAQNFLKAANAQGWEVK